MTHKEIEETLEQMIDSQGVIAVLTALVNICSEKETWVASPESIGMPDKAMARQWRKGAKAIDKAMHAVDWPL